MHNDNEKYSVLVAADRFYPAYAGWINQVMSMLKYGHEFGIHFSVYTCLLNGESKLESNEKYSIEYANITFKKSFLRKTIFGLLLLLHIIKKRNNIDVVFFPHGYHPFPVVALACYLLNIPYLVRISGLELDTKSRVSLEFRKAALKQSDATVVLNLETKQKLVEMGMRQNKIHFIPNGIDTEIFHPPTAEEKKRLRKDFGIPQDHTVFITVGNISKRKGTHKIIEAFSMYRQKYGEGMLYILGPILEKGYYEDIIKEDYFKNIEEYILFPGKVNKVASYLKASDLFLLASESEGMPNALIEAIGVGLYCICFNISGVQELTENIKSIEAVNCSTSHCLYQKISEVVDGCALKKNKEDCKKVSIVNSIKLYNYIFDTCV